MAQIPTGQVATVRNSDGTIDREVPVIAWVPEAKDEGFVKLYTLFSRKVLSDLRGDLNGATELLIWFLAQVAERDITTDPRIIVDPESVCHDLACNRRTFNRHLAKLKKLGYLRQPKPRQMVFFLNQGYVWKGTLRQKDKSQRTFPFVDTEKAHTYVLQDT